LILRHPKDTLYPAHDTANYTPDNRADWPGPSVAFVDAPRNSLGACREWHYERSDHGDPNQCLSFH
jgi:hypothetical protein